MSSKPAAEPEPQLYTVRAAAKILGLKMTRTWQFVTDGTLESIHLGGRRMVRAKSLEQLVAKGTPRKRRAA